MVNTGAAWPGFRETHEALLAWLPRAEGVTVPAQSHLLQIESPGPVADAITSMLDRHQPDDGAPAGGQAAPAATRRPPSR